VAGGRPIYGAVATAPRAGVPGREPSTDVTSPEIVSGECGMVVGTVRSGHAVRHPGNIIVFGDVNAGAEIVAGQSVVVWGALRGTVQAGARGDPTAVVCALSLAPTQLRIDDCIARAPDGPAPQREAEMARVQNGAIVVEAWSSRRPRQPSAPAGRVHQAIQDVLHRVRKGVRRWGAS
ncbi:MAG: septum site-determining protein MinC, partial [Anaerolineae bacterium]